MSSAVEQRTTARETSAALGLRMNEPAWLAALRSQSAVLADEMSFPNSSRERPWKYLDVSALDLSGYHVAVPAGGPASADELHLAYGVGQYSGLLIQRNTETVLAEGGDGFSLVDFGAADSAEQKLLERHVSATVPAWRNKFTALHYSFLAGGVLLSVSPNTELKLPVRIVRDYQAGEQLAAPHTLIVTGANSRVTVIEDFRSSDADIAVLPVVEVAAGPGSEVRYTALHRWGSNTRVFGEQALVSQRDSAFIGLNVIMGGRVVKGHLQSSLEGRGSSSELLGLVLGNDAQHVDFYTLQDHIGADTRSDLLYKSALKDTARSVYYGLTRVGLGARNADANQVNRNLLLSKTAKADSDPVLEILTNDVIRVSHGATAGPVDEEQLYYMQTRGIPHAEAEALLVRAFLGQVLDRVPDAGLRDELSALVEARLERR